MKSSKIILAALSAAGWLLYGHAFAASVISERPDPKEIPLPLIKTSLPDMPGVDQLPVRAQMPDPLLLDDGQQVKSAAQWQQRRAQMRQILEYYAVGQAPPPPGNVKGVELSFQLLNGGKVRYRLVHLSFGPDQSLGLNIGIFTPATGGPFPTVIFPGGTPPGASLLPRLANGVTQGRGADTLLTVGPSEKPREPETVQSAEEIAATNPALAHGYAFVMFNNNDCGEDTTLRNPDGSWAYRDTRFFSAYPHYDWGLLRAWAWGMSRIVDYVVTDPSVDAGKLIVSGWSRNGKAALIAGAFDERIALIAPDASSGGGTSAFRFSGSVPPRGGKEGLTEIVRKYPNWFSPHLHQFWGQPDKLPFDVHWLLALCAPRPTIMLEGDHDQNVVQNGVYQAWQAALPTFAFLHAQDKLGFNWSDRPHGMVQGDWDALLAFADKFLDGKVVTRKFDQMPAGFVPQTYVK